MCEKEFNEKIEKVEIKISYTEEIVSQLNEIIIEQQKEIRIMNKQILKLERKIDQVMEDSDASDIPSRKPPHY